MNVLVINCGSSSLKYQLFDMKNETVMAKGLVERIGLKGSSLVQKINGKENYVINEDIKDHKIAVRLVLDALVDSKYGVIKSTAEINAVGHRVVHGGEYYSSSVLIDEKVMKAIEDCVKLAPLHNPPNLIGINACRELMPNIPMVAVFDTAFHQTMPDKAFMYALPYEFYKKYGIRKYGFHGTSHKYVSGIAAKMLNKDLKDLKLITCHLGGGSSITAVCRGKSVDTTMGFTPLDGLPMGTRSGSIDPAVVTFLEKYANMTSDDMDTVLNKKSGMLGVSGISSDFRDLKEAIEEKNDKRAEIAVSMFTYKVKQYIGAYIASMNGADAIVFTAGAGENASWLRKRILTDLDFLGIKFDEKRNENNGVNEIISTDDSRIKVLVIPTNEELMIARDTKSISEKLM